MRLFSIYIILDTRAKAIIGPIQHDFSPVPIMRQVTEAANKPGLIGNTPEDFIVIEVGKIDDETGQLYTLSGDKVDTTPELVCKVAALKTHQKPELVN